MKFIDQVLEKSVQGDKPNKFTLGMGELIRKAREESGLTQRELASMIYRRQAALSEIENGLMEPGAETLLLLSAHLEKSISYFFPAKYRKLIEIGELSESEQELLIQSRKLSNGDLQKIIAQVKAINRI